MFHCTWTIPSCPSSAAHFIPSTNLTRTSRFSNDCFEGGGRGRGRGTEVGLRSELQERKKKNKGNFQSRKITKEKISMYCLYLKIWIHVQLPWRKTNNRDCNFIEVKCEIERVAELCTIASVRTLDDHACTVNILAFLQLTFNFIPLRLQTFHKEKSIVFKRFKGFHRLRTFLGCKGPEILSISHETRHVEYYQTKNFISSAMIESGNARQQEVDFLHSWAVVYKTSRKLEIVIWLV